MTATTASCISHPSQFYDMRLAAMSTDASIAMLSKLLWEYHLQ
jgi:hypothetical protein